MTNYSVLKRAVPLEVGASGAETRRIERETARLMEARDG